MFFLTMNFSERQELSQEEVILEERKEQTSVRKKKLNSGNKRSFGKTFFRNFRLKKIVLFLFKFFRRNTRRRPI